MPIYRLLITLVAPVLAVVFSLRLLRRRENGADLRERLGLDGPKGVPGGGVIWLHAASNGELASARALIEEMLRRAPRLKLVVTCNTVSGRALVRDWNLPRLHVRLAPLDYRLSLRSFLRSHQPDALILIENEIWPNRLRLCHDASIPVALLSARVSARSAERWKRLDWLLRPLLSPITLAAAQDAQSEARMVSLGIREESLGPRKSLKAAIEMAEPDPELLADYERIFPYHDTLLAASTHEGEEALVIDAFQHARHARGAMKLILAPRHPARAETVAALLDKAGLRYSRRSTDGAPREDDVAYLADTLGEMQLWYALAGQCFVGGSLVDRGGHTPFEPVFAGTAILYGPHVSNAAEPYALLDTAHAAIRVDTAQDLGAELADLTAERQSALTTAATKVLAPAGADVILSPLLASLADVTGLAELRGAAPATSG